MFTHFEKCYEQCQSDSLWTSCGIAETFYPMKQYICHARKGDMFIYDL